MRFLRVIPNIPRAEVPEGRSADENVEVRRWGDAAQVRLPGEDHVDVGAALGGIDFETAAEDLGRRFYVLKGAVARLHRASDSSCSRCTPRSTATPRCTSRTW
jgi:seryl-tRNA synthetase